MEVIDRLVEQSGECTDAAVLAKAEMDASAAAEHVYSVVLTRCCEIIKQAVAGLASESEDMLWRAFCNAMSSTFRVAVEDKQAFQAWCVGFKVDAVYRAEYVCEAVIMLERSRMAFEPAPRVWKFIESGNPTDGFLVRVPEGECPAVIGEVLEAAKAGDGVVVRDIKQLAGQAAFMTYLELKTLIPCAMTNELEPGQAMIRVLPSAPTAGKGK